MNPLDETKGRSPFSPKLVLGLAIIAIGLLGFISQFSDWGLLERWWPLILVGAGILVIRRAISDQRTSSRDLRALAPSSNTEVSCDPESDAMQVKP